jgi:Ala-tRNA(Pro) deacylase
LTGIALARATRLRRVARFRLSRNTPRDTPPRKKFPGWQRQMAQTQQELLDYLTCLGIIVKTVTHPPLHTVADSQMLRGEIEGAHTKNLFLKDKKDNYFLLTVGEEGTVDLKTIHHIIGAAGKVSFGKPEALMEMLGVAPGAVTAFGPVNDTSGKIKVFLDAGLMRHAIINCHPLVNTATTSIASSDLVTFLKATGHEPVILKLTVDSPN